MTMKNPLPMTPARRLALAVGVPLVLALIGWSAFSTVAQAGTGTFPVRHSLAIRDGLLRADVGDMDVRLVPGSGPDATLAGTVHYSLIKPAVTFSVDGSGATVDMRCPVPAGECSLNSTLTVPRGTEVNLAAGMGDLTVDGAATRAATLSTSTGDLTATDLSGTAVLRTDTGDISATGISAADVTARSDTGDITLTFTKPPRELRVHDAIGDISIVLPPGTATYDIAASSSAGDTSVQPGLRDANSKNLIVATSSTGDISITTAG